MKKPRQRNYRPPDYVSGRFPDGAIKLFTKLFPATKDGEAARVLIEGDKTSLEYLGKMILAQARYEGDCGYGISPKSAGNAFFHRGAKIGIYIHRLPSLNALAAGKDGTETPALKGKSRPIQK